MRKLLCVKIDSLTHLFRIKKVYLLQSTHRPTYTKKNMDISHQQPDDTETKISKIPKPFSIESLISTKSCSPIRPDAFETHYPPTLFPQNICLPNFPMYNPWMGYLTQSTNEQINQLFSNGPNEKFVNFLEHHPDNRHDKLSEMFLTHTANDPRIFLNSDLVHREKIAQYLANNVREPKFTEFLMNASKADFRSDDEITDEHLLTASDNNCNKDLRQTSISVRNFTDGVSNLSQLFVKSDQDKDDEMETGSESELSMTMSPDGSHKNAGEGSVICF